MPCNTAPSSSFSLLLSATKCDAGGSSPTAIARPARRLESNDEDAPCQGQKAAGSLQNTRQQPTKRMGVDLPRKRAIRTSGSRRQHRTGSYGSDTAAVSRSVRLAACGYRFEELPSVEMLNRGSVWTPALCKRFVEQGSDRSRLVEVQPTVVGSADSSGRQHAIRDYLPVSCTERDQQASG